MAKDPRDSRKWRAFRLTILARDSFTCVYCNQPANSVDHVVPVSKAPDMAFSPDNCVSACNKCNSSKGSRSEASFLARQFTPPVFAGNLSLSHTVIQLDSPFKTRPAQSHA